MAHILLPHLENAKAKQEPAGKYANTAVPCLREALVGLGAHPQRLRAWVAGGAQMFTKTGQSDGIGAENRRAIQHQLAKAHIPIAESDLGGSRGRRMTFQTSTLAIDISLMQSFPSRVQ